VSCVALAVAPLLLEQAESPQMVAQRVPDERRPIHLQSADGPVRRPEQGLFEHHLNCYHMWKLLHMIIDSQSAAPSP
jgi:hypothetical protein